ncbi:hypothetical protein CEF21_10260 [Bacillus sp. FJAT-42376]|nr:hypothetical protein CEF21_10260 [Bacillus sp. FJAT-42376]
MDGSPGIILRSRFTISGPLSTVYGPLSAIYGPLPAVYGPLPAVYGPTFPTYGPIDFFRQIPPLPTACLSACSFQIKKSQQRWLFY